MAFIDDILGNENNSTSSGVQTVTGNLVDNSDPTNPIVEFNTLNYDLNEFLNQSSDPYLHQSDLPLALFLGDFASLSALQATVPIGVSGNSANIIVVGGNNDLAIWDNDGQYWFTILGAGYTSFVPVYDAVPTNVSNNLVKSGGIFSWVNSLGFLTSVPTATNVLKGIMKLFTSTGTATDGTMTQKAITDALDGKVDLDNVSENFIPKKLNGKLVNSQIINKGNQVAFGADVSPSDIPSGTADLLIGSGGIESLGKLIAGSVTSSPKYKFSPFSAPNILKFSANSMDFLGDIASAYIEEINFGKISTDELTRTKQLTLNLLNGVLSYTSDVSANYNDRSLVDKGFVQSQLAGKVDKITGKQLSKNDYTDVDKAKLDSLSTYSGFRGVQTSLANVISAYPTGTAGDWAIISNATGNAYFAIWDNDNTTPGWVDAGQSPTIPGTNLAYIISGNSLTITSDTGTDVVIPLATSTTSGLQSKEDKTKLDALPALIYSKSEVDTIAATKSNLPVREQIGNTDATIASTTTLAVTSVSFTAPRTWTPPSGIPAGKSVTIIDEIQTITSVNTLTIKAITGKKLNGVVNGTVVMSTTGGARQLYSDGADNLIYDAGIVRQSQISLITSLTSDAQTQINNKQNPLLKRFYFDDLQGYFVSGVSGSIFFTSGTLATEGNIILYRGGSGSTWSRVASESGHSGVIRGGSGTQSTGSNQIGFISFYIGIQDFEIQSTTRIQQLSNGTNRFNNILQLSDSSNNSITLTYSDNINSGKFECKTTKAGVSTTVDSGVTVAINTWYNFKITSISGVISFYINGTLVATSSTNVPTNFDGNLQQTTNKTLGTTAITSDFDYLLFKDL